MGEEKSSVSKETSEKKEKWSLLRFVENVIVSNLLGSALGLAGNGLVGVLQLSVLPSVVGDLRNALKQKRTARNWKILVGANVISIALVTWNVFIFMVYTPYRQLVLG